jgi:Flp pilus assembly protein TadG
MNFARFLKDRSGVAMIEFALGAPFLLFFGLWGIEVANFAITNMRISQIATQIADNASRIGDTSTLKDRRIYESDINDILFGATIQAGASLDIYKRGRVVISSVEVDPTTNKQYIHWQRCKGEKVYASAYGSQGTLLPGGIGPASHQVSAEPDDAVIFVELTYEYQPLVSQSLATNSKIVASATFMVRDDRDLTQIYQADPMNPKPVASCSKYDSNTNPVP